MDIHKPKPWHGWRELLKEVGTIVVGVLIALGAEAVVENLHERRLSAEAKEAVRDEINVDITSAARRSEGGRDACLDRRMDEIAALLDAAEAGKPFTPAARIGGPLEVTVYTSRWTAATAGGRTSLLSSEEQRRFGRVYQDLQMLDLREQQEYQAWLTLRALKGLRHLSPQMIDRQRLALSQARDLNTVMRDVIRGAAIYARQLGVKGDAHLVMPYGPAPGLPVVCQPLTGASEAP